MDSIAEVVLCIESLKLKKKYFTSHISVCCSGEYSNSDETPYSTTVRPFVTGEVYGVPLVDSLQGVLVTVFSEKKDNKTGTNRLILGSVLLSLRSHISTSFSRMFELDILQETVVIGKLVGKASLYSVRAEEESMRHEGKHSHRSASPTSSNTSYSSDGSSYGVSSRGESGCDRVAVVQPVRSHPLREFGFSPLNKHINWDRIANLNLNRVARKSNIPHFDRVLDDVANGNVSGTASNCDPKILNAMKALQLSAQYINNCSEVLQGKKEKVEDAMKCFRKEEELLDRELRRRRTKEKSLKSRISGYDQLHSDYLNILNQLNPGVARDYMIGLRERETAESAAAAAAAGVRGQSSSSRPRSRSPRHKRSDSGSGDSSTYSDNDSESDASEDDGRRHRRGRYHRSRRHDDRDSRRRRRPDNSSKSQPDRPRGRSRSGDGRGKGATKGLQDDIHYIVNTTATASENNWKTAGTSPAIDYHVPPSNATKPTEVSDIDDVRAFEQPAHQSSELPVETSKEVRLRTGPVITHVQMGAAPAESDSDELEIENYEQPENDKPGTGYPPLKPTQQSIDVSQSGFNNTGVAPLAASVTSVGMSVDSLAPDYVVPQKKKVVTPAATPVPAPAPASVEAPVPHRRDSSSAAFKLANQRRNHIIDDDDEDDEQLQKQEEEDKDAAWKRLLQQKKEKRELELRLLALKKEKEDLLRAKELEHEAEENRQRLSMQSTDSTGAGLDDVQSMHNDSITNTMIDTSNSMIIDDDGTAESDAYHPITSSDHAHTFSHGLRSHEQNRGFSSTMGSGFGSGPYSTGSSDGGPVRAVTGPAAGGSINLRGINDRPFQGPGPSTSGGIDLRRVVEHSPSRSMSGGIDLRRVVEHQPVKSSMPAGGQSHENSMLMESMTDSFEYQHKPIQQQDRSVSAARVSSGSAAHPGTAYGADTSGSREMNNISADDSEGHNTSSLMEYSESQSQSQGHTESGVGMRTGVLNYLHHKHDDTPSIEIQPHGDSGENDDVLLGTMGGPGTFTGTFATSTADMSNTLGSSAVQSLGSTSMSSSQYDVAVTNQQPSARRQPAMPPLSEDQPYDAGGEGQLLRTSQQTLTIEGDDVSPLSTMSVTGGTSPPTYTPTQQQPEPQSNQSLVGWCSGRAPMENVEVGQALDVNINTVRMYPSAFVGPNGGRSPPDGAESLISVYCEFLGAGSKVSKEYLVSKSAGAGVQNRAAMSGSGAFTVQANYCCYMLFESRSALALLTEEIENEMENVSLNVVITMTTSTSTSTESGPGMGVSSSLETTLISGIARIPLYTMIENSCHIIRHEVDIIKTSTDDTGDLGADRKQSVMGSIVIDVRGYQLLEQCS